VTLFFNEHWHGSRINVKQICRSAVRSYPLQSDVNNWLLLPEDLGSLCATLADLRLCLAGSSYGPIAVQQNAAYISELQVQIPTETKNAEKLHWEVIKDRSEFEMYRNDYIKKFAYKLKGRQDEYATITSNEERKYHKTLDAQAKAQSRLESMKTQLAEAQRKQPEFEESATNHAIWHSELLLALYDSVFAPPTPPPSTKPSLPSTTPTPVLTVAPSPLRPRDPNHRAAQRRLQIPHLGARLTCVTRSRPRAVVGLGLGLGLRMYNVLGAQAVGIEHNAMAQAQSQGGVGRRCWLIARCGCERWSG
jgi:hypothetical protein